MTERLVHTVPSQVGHSFNSNGFCKSKEDGRSTNSARLFAMASATDSAVAFSPLKVNKLKNNMCRDVGSRIAN